MWGDRVMKQIPVQAMLAQIALSYGDAMSAYRVINENPSFTESIEILAQSPKYKKTLPAAFEAYTANGNRIGKVIASFPEFYHRGIVARELADIVEGNNIDVMEATEYLENPHVKEQLAALKKQFPKRDNFVNSVLELAVKLAVKNAVYGQSATIDRMIESESGNRDAVYAVVHALQLAVKNYNAEAYPAIVNEIFGLYDELEKKLGLSVIDPGIKANDIELVQALRSFANTYDSTKDENRFSLRFPEFDKPAGFYSWKGNTFADTVRRVKSLVETGRKSFVDDVVNRMNNYNNRQVSEEQIYETNNPADILNAAERIKDANLPEEVYIALRKECETISLVGFANRILQEPVLDKIRALDKMGAHLGKAAIAYTACYEPPENVRYVAENILAVNQLGGKTNSILKAVMYDARSENGAARLEYFLPEGINIRKLPANAKKVIRRLGFGDIEHKEIVHRLLRENPEALKQITEEQCENFPRIYSYDNNNKVNAKLEKWLGLKVKTTG